MARKLKLTIEPISGAHNYFVIKINDKIIKHGPAKKMTKTQNISDNKTSIYVSSLGIGTGPKYKVTMDLEGTTDDHETTYSLNKGYHEVTYIL